MIIKNALLDAQRLFQNAAEIEYLGQFSTLEIARPMLEAEMLMGYVLNCSRVFLHTHIFKALEPLEAKRFFALVDRRVKGEPIEYLIEKVSFYGETFYITKGVLIPRPETEILVEKALLEIQNGAKRIAEIGVGSGIISITLSRLSKELGLKVEFFANDISPYALFVAHCNSYAFKCANIHLYNASFLDHIPKNIDLLLSNPPYIPNHTPLPLPLKYEPKLALFSGDSGTNALFHIITQAKKHNIPKLICEMGNHQKALIQSFTALINPKRLEFYKDLSGLDRGFILEF